MNVRHWIMMIFMAAGVVWTAAPTRADDDTVSLAGKPAPGISLSTIDGKKIKLSDQKGKVVVIDFWATWCGDCMVSLPHVQQMNDKKEWADKGLVVWAINAAEKPQIVKDFLKEKKFTFTVPMDDDRVALNDYKVNGIPATVIVGRDG